MVGRTMHSLIHHSHGDGSPYAESACPIYAAFRDGVVHRVDNEVFWRKDGRLFAVEYTSTPIVDRGQLIGAVIVFRDVSDRRETEQRLHSALDEVSRLKKSWNWKTPICRRKSGPNTITAKSSAAAASSAMSSARSSWSRRPMPAY
jgi:hypothetical protein